MGLWSEVGRRGQSTLHFNACWCNSECVLKQESFQKIQLIYQRRQSRERQQASWMAGLESVSSSGAFQIMGCLRAGLGQTITIENTGSIREYLRAPVSFSYAHLISVAKGNRPQFNSLKLQLFTNKHHKCNWTLPTSADRLVGLVVLTLAWWLCLNLLLSQPAFATPQLLVCFSSLVRILLPQAWSLLLPLKVAVLIMNNTWDSKTWDCEVREAK